MTVRIDIVEGAAGIFANGLRIGERELRPAEFALALCRAY